MDSLPVEILSEVAGISEEAYKAIALIMRLFAQTLSPGSITDWQIHFGHSIIVTKDIIKWTRHGVGHRIGGPAVISLGSAEMWMRRGVEHRIGGPAVSFTLSGGQILVQKW